MGGSRKERKLAGDLLARRIALERGWPPGKLSEGRGVHPGRETRAFAPQVVYDGLIDAINKHCPELQRDKLQRTLPDFDYFFYHSVEDYRAGVDLDGQSK